MTGRLLCLWCAASRYGLGTIYLKQEKYQLAEYHFRRALEINPRNSVLHCYRGMALLSNHMFDQAIAVLQKAKEMDPANPLARLRKAMALSHVDRNDEALEELLSLQQLAPRESTVYVQVRVPGRAEIQDLKPKPYPLPPPLPPTLGVVGRIDGATGAIYKLGWCYLHVGRGGVFSAM